MKKFISVIAILSVSVSLGLSKITYSSSKKKPKWITHPPSDKINLYFIGAKTKASSLEEGKKSAIEGVVKEIVDYFGIQAESTYEETKSYFTSQIKDRLKTKGKAEIKGISVKELYYEKEKIGNDIYYNVFVLISYPLKEAQKEKERLKQQNKRKIIEARNAFNIAKSRLKEKQITLALNGFYESLNLLNQAWGCSALKREIINEASVVLQNIKIKTLPYEKNGKTTTGLKNPLKIKLTYKGIPLRNYPVKFHFIEGTGLLQNKVYTDENGVASSKVSRINLALQTNIVEASMIQDILPDFTPAKATFIFSSSGESFPLLTKLYNLSFKSDELKEEIGINKNGKLNAILKIHIPTPTTTQQINLRINKVPEGTVVFNKPKQCIDTEGIEFTDIEKNVEFFLDEIKRNNQKETYLSPFLAKITIKNFKTKEFKNPYSSGSFKGIENIALELKLFYGK